jgi:hypothetical protein
MTDEELAKALFEAARQRRPSDAAREATRNAMRVAARRDEREVPGRSRRIVWAGLFAAAAVLVIMIVVRARTAPTPTISAENAPSWRTPETNPLPVPSVEEALAPPSPVQELPSSAPRRAVRPHAEKPPEVEKAPEPRPAPSLSDEVGALDRVRAALGASDSTRALQLLDDYDGVLNGRRLAAEATLLRVEALARSGRRAEAERLARRFIEANPGSPLAEGARAFIGPSTSAPDSGS